MLQAVRLVPAGGEDIKGDLTANRVARSSQRCPTLPAKILAGRAKGIEQGRNPRKSQIRELLLQHFNHLLPDMVLLVVPLVLVPLVHGRVPANRAHVYHAVPELDKRAALDWNIQVRNVPEQEVYQLLVLVLAEPSDEGLRCQPLAHPVRGQSVLGEAEVEERRHWD